jgi:uncharacterized membrane protein
MTSLFPSLLFIASIGAGLNAGLFFIFSVCIMAALARLPAPEGIAAMNAINAVIQNPLFFLVFMGTALLAVAIIALAFLQSGAANLAAIAGALVFLIGTIGVTIVVNVPMNNALAAADPASPAAADLWKSYLVNWTNWNHVRSLSSLAALAIFVTAFAKAADA